MFKWPDDPSPQADAHELADFVELVAWRYGSMSVVDLTRYLGRLDEADYSDGVPEEDEVAVRAEEAFGELERRSEICSGGYPFSIDRGQTARFAGVGGGERHMVYTFLLLATRLNMTTQRTHRGLDGTALFEELAAESARRYLGQRSQSLVFGTSAHGTGFRAKVDDLCRRIGEGNGFAEHGGSGSPRDGKLDVVAWTPFSDGLPGQLLVFGQCETGTHFKDQLTQLQPDAFCSKWFRSQPAVMPVRAFFVTEALSRSHWRDVTVDAGLLFDRCRIVDFTDHAGGKVLADVEAWTTEAWARSC